MIIQPINDNNSRFDLVEVKTTNSCNPTPHCWHPSDDVYHYGFSLDFTTEMYYHTYDWGKGFNFRLLGWGFEITRMGQ